IRKRRCKKIVEYYKQGYSVTEISRKCGVSRPTVYNTLKDFLDETEFCKMAGIEKSVLKSYRNGETNISKLASKHNISRDTVYRILGSKAKKQKRRVDKRIRKKIQSLFCKMLCYKDMWEP